MLKIKIRDHYLLQRLLAAAVLCLLIVIGLLSPLDAQTVTQGFSADQPLQRGLLVRLKAESTDRVEPASQDSADQLYGVVVDPNDAPVTISSEGQQIFVAKNGQFDVLVSDQNGAITSGDFISLSAVPGIGMKSDQEQPVVAGQALSDFNAQDGVISTMEIRDENGDNRQLQIGRIRLDIAVGSNPSFLPKKPNVPGFLQTAAETIADKPVNATRIYLSLIIFIIMALVAGSLLYAGVRGSMTALGRNPLSRGVIGKGLMQVTLTSLIIFITGLSAVYLLLKL